jgi:hypothetical protein
MDRVRTLFPSVILHATTCIISVPVPCLGLVVRIRILTGILAPVRRRTLRHLSWLQAAMHARLVEIIYIHTATYAY